MACIEEWKDPAGKPRLGGTCLNVGCIPSKALLASSEHFEQAKHGLAEHGVQVKGVTLDLAQMIKRKAAIVDKFTGGVEFLFRKNKVDYVQGAGSIPKPGEVAVQLNDGGSRTLAAKHILIATGSESTPLAGVEVDEKQIVTSTGALALAKELAPVASQMEGKTIRKVIFVPGRILNIIAK